MPLTEGTAVPHYRGYDIHVPFTRTLHTNTLNASINTGLEHKQAAIEKRCNESL